MESAGQLETYQVPVCVSECVERERERNSKREVGE